jgi:hypothetical protein
LLREIFTEDRRRIKEAITVVMGLRELLKGTYFSNSVDETFSESCLSSMCNRFLSMIVLDHCVPNKLVIASLAWDFLRALHLGSVNSPLVHFSLFLTFCWDFLVICMTG